MGTLIVGAHLLGLALSGLATLIGIYLLTRQRRRASVWQILASFLAAVICAYVFVWAVDFGEWMARIRKLHPSEAAGHYIPLAFTAGLAPGIAALGFVSTWIVINSLSPTDQRDQSNEVPGG